MPRPDLPSSPNQAGIVPFVKKLLLAWSGTKAFSEALSLIQEEMPRMPDLGAIAKLADVMQTRGLYLLSGLSIAAQIIFWIPIRSTNCWVLPRRAETLQC
jgi:hypothetical protein